MEITTINEFLINGMGGKELSNLIAQWHEFLKDTHLEALEGTRYKTVADVLTSVGYSQTPKNWLTDGGFSEARKADTFIDLIFSEFEFNVANNEYTVVSCSGCNLTCQTILNIRGH